MIQVAALLPHPEGSAIYDPSDVTELKNLIEVMGLLQPIVINTLNQVLIGSRRLKAITLLEWQEVEVCVVDIPQEDEAAYIVNSNSQRQKSSVEIYKEIKVLKSYWAKNQGTRTDLIPGLTIDEKSKTRDRIARSIGVPQTTIHKIETVGDKDLELLKLVDNGLFNSLHEAYQTARLEKPVYEKEVEDIDLLTIESCPLCSCATRRIVEDENGNLSYQI